MGRLIRVSAKSARLRFHGCDPDYIRTVCHGRCCESSTAPQGTSIAIHESERERIVALGGVVVAGILQTPNKVCGFKMPEGFCGLHLSGQKPFGCIASPFVLNKNDTLIVRNRYKLLRCYDVGPRLPAYVAFRASLDLILGTKQAWFICAALDEGAGDLPAVVEDGVYQILTENEAHRFVQLNTGGRDAHGRS